MKRNSTNSRISVFVLRSFSLLTIIFLAASGFSHRTPVPGAPGIEFFTGTWKQAVEKAQKENKPIFMDVYAKWCGPCKLLKKNTFTNKNVAVFYNKNFINISFDAEKGEGAEIATQLGVTAFPTLFYFNKNGKPVLYSLGYHEPGQLIEAGKAALKNIQ